MGIGPDRFARNRIALRRERAAELSLDWTAPFAVAALLLALRFWIIPQLFPEWNETVSWAFALLGALALFFSTLLHELARSIMGTVLGLKLDRITIFAFAGNTQFRSRSRSRPRPGARKINGSPSLEMATVLIGPAVHLVLGVSFLSLVPHLRPIADLSPLFALLAWIGGLNLALGLLQVLPAFPLDGGRALRVMLWSITRSSTRATRWAATFSQLSAWALMALGVAVAVGLEVPLIGENRIGGFALVAGGWLLHHAAMISYTEDLVRDALSHVAVSDLMHHEPTSVSRATSVSSFLTAALILPEKHTLPVVDDDNLLGMVRLDDVTSVPQEDWARTPVAQIMIPLSQIPMLAADDDADLALQLLVHRGVEQLPVVERGRVLGFVHRWDIIHWLANHDVAA